jgi:hypothetical protein
MGHLGHSIALCGIRVHIVKGIKRLSQGLGWGVCGGGGGGVVQETNPIQRAVQVVFLLDDRMGGPSSAGQAGGASSASTGPMPLDHPHPVTGQ